MHPAYSIILFTAAAGAGYGLLASVGLLATFSLLPADRGLAWLLLLPALVLVSAGLLASVAHLGRPERAWRAFSQWRTSWLSREGVAALATYAAALPLLLAWAVLGHTGPATALLGLASALLAAVTVACTGMIYASLKPIAAWRSRWTVPVYAALAAETGLLLLTGLASLRGAGWLSVKLAACLAIAAAFLLKEAYWRQPGPSTSTPETATGLGHLGRVRLLEAPHTETNYLLREMGYRVARRHARRLRALTRLLAFALPLLLALPVATDLLPAWASLPAALSAATGVLIERWLFFAEARHTVTLYYGDR